MAGISVRGTVLQERDKGFAGLLGDFGVADRDIVMEIGGWTSVTRVNARLLQLLLAGFLERCFIGTPDGGRKAVYWLSPKGATLVGLPYRCFHKNRTGIAVIDPSIHHHLEVNRFRILIGHRQIPLPDARFVRWITFREPLSATSQMIPDGYFEIQTAHGIQSMFLEMDLGTERGERWPDKTRRYIQLAVSGEFQKLFQQPRFRVVVVVPSERRLQFLRKIIAKQTEKIFWLTSLEQINRDSVWSAIWYRPTGDQVLSLT